MKIKLIFVSLVVIAASNWVQAQFVTVFDSTKMSLIGINQQSIEYFNSSAACVTYSTRKGVRCGDASSLEYTIINECSTSVSATTWTRGNSSADWYEGSSYFLYPGNEVIGWWCKEPFDWKITYKTR